MYHANSNRAGVAILMSDNAVEDKNCYCIQKRAFYNDERVNPSKDVTIINIHSTNNRVPNT